MGPTTLFSTIYGFHSTISANFYLYLQYFQQKNFNFRKISDPKHTVNLNLYNFLKQANCFSLFSIFKQLLYFSQELNIQQKHSNLQTV